MENVNKKFESFLKSENDTKKEPIKNNIFSKNRNNIMNKILFTNVLLKKSIEQIKNDDRIFSKSLMTNKKNKNIIKSNTSRNIKKDKKMKDNRNDKLLKISFRENGNKSTNSTINSNKNFNINKFLHDLSVIKRKRILNNLENFLSNSTSIKELIKQNKIIQINNNQKSLSLKTSKEIKKLKNKSKTKNLNNNIKYNKNLAVKVRLLNLSLSKLKEPKKFNKVNSIDNEKTILSEKNSIKMINFFSHKNKNEYLFHTIKKKNSRILDKVFNENKAKTIYNLKNYFVKSEIKNSSKSNKIFYNISDKNNSLVNIKNISSYKSQKNNYNKQESKNIYEQKNNKTFLNRKINNQTIHNINSKKIHNIKYNFISEINHLKEIEHKSNSVINKRNLINIMTLIELQNKKA